MAEEASKFIERRRDEPFFLNYWQFSVHAPFDAKQSLINKYRPLVDPKDPPRSPTYAAMVESFDDAIGTLLDTLDRLELANDTIIIFTSDNGGNMYDEVDGVSPTDNAPLRGGKATMYEGGVRVPWITVWPGVTEPAATSDALVQTTDIFPTILEMAGLDVPAGQTFDGVSLVPALKGGALERDAIFTYFPHAAPVPEWLPPSASVHWRQEDGTEWKLIRLFHQGGGPLGGPHALVLYKLTDDPGETTNLLAKHQVRADQLNRKLGAWLADSGAPLPLRNPNFDPTKFQPELIGASARSRRRSNSAPPLAPPAGGGASDRRTLRLAFCVRVNTNAANRPRRFACPPPRLVSPRLVSIRPASIRPVSIHRLRRLEFVRCLFVDMNSFFASAEQHLRPELRGRPVGVAPVSAETTCFIAASVEAKRFGIRTGTPVHEGRRRCPGLQVVKARPHEYVPLHHRIVAAVNDVVPVDAVESIDEMNCLLTGPQRRLAVAIDLAHDVKRAIATRIGPTLRCSVGLAPNRMLAKTASDLQKPDGLTALPLGRLPWALYGLELRAFPGIGPRMERRLERHGITTVAQLCAQPPEMLETVWGGIVGRRWWHWLRGDEVRLPPTKTRSLGHSHVLPPALRTEQGAYGVLCRLIHKAAARLRRGEYTARRMDVWIGYIGRAGAWKATLDVGYCRDTPTLLTSLAALWSHYPQQGAPLKVAVTLHRLAAVTETPRSLFHEDRRRERLSVTMDAINARFGVDAVYFACMHAARRTAPMRIAFGRIPEAGEGAEDAFAVNYSADPEVVRKGVELDTTPRIRVDPRQRASPSHLPRQRRTGRVE